MASKEEFGRVLLGLANVMPIGKPDLKSKGVMRVWYESFGHLSAVDLNKAAKRAMRAYDRFPSVRQFDELVGGPTASRDAQANEIAGKIWHAIGSIGGYRNEKAEEYIGKAGWAVVRMLGGWQQVCETTYPDQHTLKHAVMRNLGNVVLTNQGLIENGTPAIGSEAEEEGRKAIQGAVQQALEAPKGTHHQDGKTLDKSKRNRPKTKKALTGLLNEFRKEDGKPPIKIVEGL